MAQENLKYKSFIIKLSGEALAGETERVSMPKSSLTFARKSQT